MTYKAIIMEYERGWGSRVDSTRDFDTEAERDAFIIKYNSKNTEEVVPDYYTVAISG